ncbi:MAG: hypothetical protein ACYDDO_04120 [Acidiferrobacterales bacterium]
MAEQASKAGSMMSKGQEIRKVPLTQGRSLLAEMSFMFEGFIRAADCANSLEVPIPDKVRGNSVWRRYDRCELLRGASSRTLGIVRGVDGARVKASFGDGIRELVMPRGKVKMALHQTGPAPQRCA